MSKTLRTGSDIIVLLKTVVTITKYYASLELNLLRSRNTGRFHRYISRKLQSRVNILEIALPSGTITRNPSEISDIFNFYFSSVFTIENNENPITSCETQAEMNEIRFTPDVVRMTLLGLNSSLSTGPDGIPNIVLKIVHPLWLYRLPIYLTFPLKIKSCPATGKWH